MRLLQCLTTVILCIGMTLETARGQETKAATTDEADLSDSQQVSDQLASLNTGHEQLKVRLEMMKQYFEEQEREHNEIEQKFEEFEKKLDMLQNDQLEELEKHNTEVKKTLNSVRTNECHQVQSEVPVNDENTELLSEFQKLTQQQEIILTKLDGKCQTKGISSSQNIPVYKGGLNVCWGLYVKILRELNSNQTTLQNIDKNLANIDDLYTGEIDKHKKSLAVAHGVLKFFNMKEDAKICKGSNEQMLMCTEEPYPTSCADYDSAHCFEHKCRIKNTLYGPETFVVACDDSAEGGGWTVIQRRLDGSVDFYRGWDEYKTGFGNIDGEFWIGLDKLHALTTSLAPVELLIQLRDHDDVLKYAKYGKFAIGNETELYELKEAEDYEGDVGDSFSPHKGQKFTTKDRDNDILQGRNCAKDRWGAWWYVNCEWSNLNGFYFKNGYIHKNFTGLGVTWGNFHGYNYSLKFVQMMIRPKKSENGSSSEKVK